MCEYLQSAFANMTTREKKKENKVQVASIAIAFPRSPLLFLLLSPRAQPTHTLRCSHQAGVLVILSVSHLP